MGRHRIQWRNSKITNTHHTKKRYHTAARYELVEKMKQSQSPTANHHQKILLDEHTNQ